MGATSVWNGKLYSSNLMSLLQREGSLLRSTVYDDGMGFKGEQKFVEQIGNREAVERTTKYGETVWQTPDAYRRLITKKYWEYNTEFSNIDKLNQLVDPESAEMKNAVFALGRKIDDTIISALYGTALGGADGTTSITLASYLSGTHVIAAGAASMTMAKLRTVNQLFRESNVPDGEERFMLITPKEEAALLALTEFTSSDFNTVKTLVSGRVYSFMGFNFIIHTGLPQVSAENYCIAYTKTGIQLAMSQEITATLDRLPTRNNNMGLITQMAGGATRLEEGKVVLVKCA